MRDYHLSGTCTWTFRSALTLSIVCAPESTISIVFAARLCHTTLSHTQGGYQISIGTSSDGVNAVGTNGVRINRVGTNSLLIPTVGTNFTDTNSVDNNTNSVGTNSTGTNHIGINSGQICHRVRTTNGASIINRVSITHINGTTNSSPTMLVSALY